VVDREQPAALVKWFATRSTPATRTWGGYAERVDKYLRWRNPYAAQDDPLTTPHGREWAARHYRGWPRAVAKAKPGHGAHAHFQLSVLNARPALTRRPACAPCPSPGLTEGGSHHGNQDRSFVLTALRTLHLARPPRARRPRQSAGTVPAPPTRRPPLPAGGRIMLSRLVAWWSNWWPLISAVTAWTVLACGLARYFGDGVVFVAVVAVYALTFVVTGVLEVFRYRRRHTGMVRVRILHNLATGGFGLDTHASGHTVTEVFRTFMPAAEPDEVCERVFELLNVDHDPDFTDPVDPRAVHYRDLGNRSLSFPGESACCRTSCCSSRAPVWVG
jgi:hypothetical protein